MSFQAQRLEAIIGRLKGQRIELRSSFLRVDLAFGRRGLIQGLSKESSG